MLAVDVCDGAEEQKGRFVQQDRTSLEQNKSE